MIVPAFPPGSQPVPPLPPTPTPPNPNSPPASPSNPINTPPAPTEKTIVFKATTVTSQSAELRAKSNYSDLIVARYSGSLNGFEAEINWGDGQKSPGIITSSGTITGNHNYQRPGAYSITTSVRKASGSTSLHGDARTFSIRSGVFVDTPSLSVNGPSGPSLSISVQSRLTNVQLASFTSGGDSAVAIVEWGDGTISEARAGQGDVQVTQSGVVGSHSYSLPGRYVVRTTVRDGAQLNVTKLPVQVSPSQTVLLPLTPALAIAERQELRDTPSANHITVGIVTDWRFLAQGIDRSATIFWGDGSTTEATLTTSSTPGSVDIRGATHVYRESGAIPLRVLYDVKYQDATGYQWSEQLEFINTVDVTAPQISAIPSAPSYAARSVENQILASFTIPTESIHASAADFIALVDWGDGASYQDGSARATIAGSGTQFYVYGTHDYPNVGQYTATVRIMEAGTPTQVQTVRKTFTVVDGIAGARSGFRPVAFKMPADTRPGMVSIAWGDGQSSAVDPTRVDKDLYVVEGHHRYRSAGTYQVEVTVKGTKFTRQLVIAPGRLYVPDIAQLNTSPGFAVSSFDAFNFSEDDFWNAPNFTGTIDWGDGQQSSASITANTDGTYRVTASGSHTYTTNSSTIQASLILVDTSTTFPQSRVVPLKTTLDQVPDTTEIFLYNNGIDADTGKLEAIFSIDKNSASYENQLATMHLVTASGQPTGLQVTDTIQSGLARAVFTIPSNLRRAGRQFYVKTILAGHEYRSELAQVVAGAAASFEWTVEAGGTKHRLTNPSQGLPFKTIGSQPINIVVLAKDQFGNPISDGELVTWNYEGDIQTDDIHLQRADSFSIGKTLNGRSQIWISQAPLFLKVVAEIHGIEVTQIIVGTEVDTVAVQMGASTLYYDATPYFTYVAATVRDVHGQPVVGAPVQFFDQFGLVDTPMAITDGLGIAIVTANIPSSVATQRLRGTDHVWAVVGGKSSPKLPLQIERVPSDTQPEVITVDSPIIASSVDSALQAYRWNRINGSPNQDLQFTNHTTVRLHNLNPSKQYKIVLYGQGANADLHLGQNNDVFSGDFLLTVPPGVTSFQTAVWANIQDGSARKIRLVLEELVLPSIGYGEEVDSRQSWIDFLAVPTIDPATNDYTEDLAFVESLGVIGDVVMGAVFGSGNSWSSFSGEMAISLIPVVGVWPDVRDVAAHLWKYSQVNLSPIEKFELTLSALGIMAEFGVVTDYFVDATKGVFKAVKVASNGANFTALSLVALPFLQPAVDYLYEATLGKVFPASTGTNTFGLLSSGGAEGESPAQAAVRALKQLVVDANWLNKKDKRIIMRAANALDAMVDAATRGADGFTELLTKLQTKFGPKYEQMVGRMLDEFPTTKLVDMFDELADLTRAMPNGDEIAQKGVRALFTALGTADGNNAKVISMLVGNTSGPQELAELVVKLGTVASKADADPVKMGKALRAMLQSDTIQTIGDAKKLFTRVDTLVDMLSSGPTLDTTSIKGIRKLLHSLGSNDNFPRVQGIVAQLDMTHTLANRVSTGNVPPEFAGAVRVRVEVRQPTGDLKRNTKGKDYAESQEVDVVYVDANNNVIGNVEVKTFRITNTNSTSNKSTIKRTEDQLKRYLKLKKNGQEFRYAVPDSQTADRIIAALSGEVRTNFQRVFGERIDVLLSENPKVYKYFQATNSDFYR